jgi:hypothetical protein
MSDQIRQCDAGHLSLGAGNWECITLEADSERLAETLDALNESRGKIIKLEAQMEELTRKLECPTSDEIIVAIESLEERKEKDYIYQRERAAQAEAEVESWKRNVDITGAELRDAYAEVERLRAAYLDLIMQVANKWPGENRHDTAKRYIVEREAQSAQGSEAKSALRGEGEK